MAARPSLTRAAIACALALATVALYARVERHGFVSFDDTGYVVSNAHVRSGLTWEGLRWALSSTELANWHPLTWISHMLDSELFGLDPGAQHLHSVLLHALATVLLFCAFSSMTDAIWRSALVAALFALHPLQVESVAWVAERKNVLCTVLAFLTFYAWARYARRPTAARYLLALASFALGLMAKPMLVTLPFVLLLLDRWPLGRVGPGDDPAVRRQKVRRLLLEKAPFFALAAVSSVVTFVVQQRGEAVLSLAVFPFAARLQNSALAYVTYLRRIFWPSDLAYFYPYPATIPIGSVFFALVVLAAVFALVFLLGRTRPYLAVSWLWFLGTLVPVLGLVQVGTQALADRYAYLPIVGIFVALAWASAELVPRVPRGTIVVPAVMVLLLGACASVTARQIRFWESDRTLALRALAVTDGNYVAEDTLGTVLMGEGRPEEAILHHRQALRLDPTLVSARINLGMALAQVGRYEEAIAEYREALKRRPQAVEAWNDLGIALARTERLAEGAESLRRALAIDPHNAESHANLGLILEAAGRFHEAADHYRAYLELRPQDAEMSLRLARVDSELGADGAGATLR